VRGQRDGLRPLVGMWFQVHYPPLKGVLPIVRSRYRGTLSVAGEYLALRDGPRSFRPASTCPVLLRCQAGGLSLCVRDYHPLWSPFPGLFRWPKPCSLPLLKESLVLQPRPDESRRFGLGPVRSPLLGPSRLLSFPRGTEMFQFPPFAPAAYGFSGG
jgi:hypothetical protein